MNTPCAGAEGMLPQMKGKLTILIESHHVFRNVLVNSFPLSSVSTCRSRNEADFTVSVVPFISSSLGVDAMYPIPDIRIV